MDNVRSEMRVTECPRVLVAFLTDMNVLFGFHMPNYTHPGVPNEGLFDRVVHQAKAAEKAGFDLVTVMDHFYQIRGIGPETEPMMEAYTTLGALAASTSRVKLGTLVTGVTYRNPAMLAKMVTTLDVISKGRAILGIGAAWNEDEHEGYGFEFPPIGQRMDRLDEALTIAKLMFTQDRPSFEGKYYRIDRALNVPRPIQAGGPKILIGGTGERRTLRLLAQHGDIGHWFGGPIEELNRKKQIFYEHCEAVKRDPAEVQLTLGVTLVLVENEKDGKAILDSLTPERRAMAKVATVPHAADLIGKYIDAGFTGFTLNNNIYGTDESIALAGELMKVVRGSAVSA
jgi:F420-dependent oxidoreductase-like protein